MGSKLNVQITTDSLVVETTQQSDKPLELSSRSEIFPLQAGKPVTVHRPSRSSVPVLIKVMKAM